MRRPLRQRVIGAIRLTLSLLAIVVPMPLLIALSYLPLRRRGVPWAAWGATMLARTLLLTLGVRLQVTAAERAELGRTRGLFDGGWCVAARSGPLSAELIYLEPIDTTAAEPADLAAAVRARLADASRTPRGRPLTAAA